MPISHRYIAVIVVVLATHAFAEKVPTSIFDDNWQASQPDQRPAATGVTPLRPDARPAAPPTAPLVPNTPPANSPAVSVSPTAATPKATPPAPLALVPTTVAQQKAWKALLNDIYKKDWADATTPTQKADLAQKMLSVGVETNNDSVAKYVLLNQASDLAISAGDPVIAFSCLDEMNRHYSIDYPARKFELFTALSRTISTPADCGTLVQGLNRWADAQVRTDRPDVAKKAIDLAALLAPHTEDPALTTQTQSHQKQIGDIAWRFPQVKKTLESLHTNPKDPAANLAAGRFFCLLEGNWDRGLPMLSLGSDATLRGIARKELAGSADAPAAVGDLWWDYSEKETAGVRDTIRDHAAGLYRRALPGLTGVAKARAQARLRELNHSSAELASDFKLSGQASKGPDGAVELKDADRVTSVDKFGPPVEFTINAETDSTNIRLTYDKMMFVFNWEQDMDQLRIDNGPPGIGHVPNFGRIPVNQWVELKLQFLPNSLTILVDGKQRYHATGDFSKTKGTLAVWPAFGSVVHIRSIVARKPEQ